MKGIPGALEVGATGFRKAAKPVPVSDRDVWHPGFKTKLMTATLAGIFVAEGKLFRQARMKDLFPEFSGQIHPS